MRICACAHVRITLVLSENNFFSKNIIFSRRKFFSKNLVVLFVINNININVRTCAYAHAYPPHTFFSFTYLHPKKKRKKNRQPLPRQRHIPGSLILQNELPLLAAVLPRIPDCLQYRLVPGKRILINCRHNLLI